MYNEGGTIRFYDTAEFSENGAKVAAGATEILQKIRLYPHAGVTRGKKETNGNGTAIEKSLPDAFPIKFFFAVITCKVGIWETSKLKLSMKSRFFA